MVAARSARRSRGSIVQTATAERGRRESWRFMILLLQEMAKADVPHGRRTRGGPGESIRDHYRVVGCGVPTRTPRTCARHWNRARRNSLLTFLLGVNTL